MDGNVQSLSWDDARYANTLYEAYKNRVNSEKAREMVSQLVPGREVNWRKACYEPALDGLSYEDVRRRLVKEIIKQRNGK